MSTLTSRNDTLPVGPHLVVAAVALAAFGPYVANGVRTEQLVVYAITPIALLALAGKRGVPRVLAAVGATWLIYTAVGAVGAALPPENRTSFAFGSGSAGLDNLALPFAVLVIGMALATRSEPVVLAKTLSWCAALLMVANTGAAVAQSQGIWDWSAWWSADMRGFTVAGNAAGNGRFSGLINQPAEAGLLYGIAMLAAIYLWAESRPRRLFGFLAVLTYGGVMTVSKVFLLVALPIVVWQVFTLRKGRAGRLLSAGAAAFGAYVIVQAGWLPAWTGADQLAQVLPQGDQSLLAAVTASRFGESSTLQPVIAAVLETSPVFGMGAAGLLTPYDNGLVEALIVAGLIGAFAYAWVLWLWMAAWSQAPRSRERTLLGGLVLLTVGASMGVPALTANRGATILWLLVTLLVVAAQRQSAPASSQGVGSQQPVPLSPSLPVRVRHLRS